MVCTKCNVDKPTDEFYWRNKAANKKHSQCKECSKEARKYNEHYIKYKEQYKLRANNRKIAAKTEINNYKQTLSCEICGYNNCSAALEFHHIDPNTKSHSISKMLRNSMNIDDIKNEIKKCKVLCANCHRELHHNV